MTISRAASGTESFLIGQPSSPQSAKPPRGAEVIYGEFTAARPLPLANTRSLGAIMAQLQGVEGVAAALPDARRRVGAALYGEGATTLAALRLRAGMSQAQLAEKAGSSQPHIARIERGQNDPSTDLIVRIAEALGVSEADAFAGVRAHLRLAGESQ